MNPVFLFQHAEANVSKTQQTNILMMKSPFIADKEHITALLKKKRKFSSYMCTGIQKG
jgi:hypothetical protein